MFVLTPAFTELSYTCTIKARVEGQTPSVFPSVSQTVPSLCTVTSRPWESVQVAFPTSWGVYVPLGPPGPSGCHWLDLISQIRLGHPLRKGPFFVDGKGVTRFMAFIRPPAPPPPTPRVAR